MKCLYVSKPYLEVECKSLLLKPGDSEEMVLTFKPTEITKYEEKIEFEVNGISKKSISVKGEGVPLKVYIHVDYIDV